jgi:hypothetical protein
MNNYIIRADKEFVEFMAKTKKEIAENLKVDINKISNPVATQKIIRWARIGKEFGDKQKGKSGNDKFVETMNRFVYGK